MSTKVGQRVTIKGKEEEYGEGTVRFVGIVKFDAGKWVGIDLDKPRTCSYLRTPDFGLLLLFLTLLCSG